MEKEGAIVDKEAFWLLIDGVNAESDGTSQDTILRLTENKLMELPSAGIRDWYSIQQEYSNLAYRNELGAAYSAISGRWSDDGFIDFRAWLISQGKEVYMTAIHDPDALNQYDFDCSEVDFEGYGYVAPYAYARKVVLEQGGTTLLDQMHREWWSRNAERITAQFESKSLSESEKNQYLEKWFKSHLTIQHDVHTAQEQCPLSDDCLASVRLDQNKKPDIDPNWLLDDLPEIVPKLYAKYNSQDMMTIYTVHI